MRPGLLLCSLLVVGAPLALPAADGPIIRLGSDHFRQRQQVDAIVYSPDGKRLATADGSSIHIWDTADGRRLHTVPLVNSKPFALQFTPDGRTLLVADNVLGRTDLCRIDSETGKLIESKNVVSGPSNGRFSPDGAYLAIRNHSGELLQIIDTVTRQAVLSDQMDAKESFSDHAWRADGKVLASATLAGFVRLHEIKSGKMLHQFRVDGQTVWGMTFSPDGTELVALIYTNPGYNIARLDASTGKVKWKYATFRADDIAFSADGKSVFYFGSAGIRAEAGRWHWLDAETGKQLGQVMDAGYGHSIALLPDRKVLALGGSDGLISQWDLTTRKRLDASAEPPEQVTQLGFSPNGSKVRGWARGWYEWDVKTGKQTRLTPQLVIGATESVIVSRDLRWLCNFTAEETELATYAPRRLEFLDLMSGAKVQPTERVGREDRVRFLSNGRVLTTGRHELRTFDPATGKQLVRIDGNWSGMGVGIADNGTTAIRLNPTEQGLVIERWSLATGQRLSLATAVLPDINILDSNSKWSTRLSPDGRMLCLLMTFHDKDREVLLEIASGCQLAHWETICSAGAVFAPDARSLVTFARSRFGFEVREVPSGGLRFEAVRDFYVTDCCISPNGGSLAVSPGSKTGAPVELWSLTARQAVPSSIWDGTKVDEYWTALADSDAKKAFTVIGQSAAHPTNAISLLKQRVKVRTGPTKEWLIARIENLDARVYRDRERATADLAQLGELVEAPLRAALPTASPEARERLKGLLAKLEKTTPEQLRAIRACEILEGIGTSEARALLAEWAKGPAGATLCREAGESLERLKARGK
jgi:WD40 repeat protein